MGYFIHKDITYMSCSTNRIPKSENIIFEIIMMTPNWYGICQVLATFEAFKKRFYKLI